MTWSRILTYGGVFLAGGLAVVGYLALGGPTPSSSTTEVPAPASVGADTTAPTASAGGTESSMTPISDVARNTMVSVSGTVERISDEDEFVLADASGSIPVWTGNQFFTVDQGETVVVKGFVDDDLILEIYATEITRADGSIVTIGKGSDR